MKHRLLFILFAIIISAVSCKTTRNTRSLKNDDGQLEMLFILINDVYEIAPLSGGKSGGIARVATIRKQYTQLNPNTLLVVAGDFVSPSVFNSLKYNDTPIRGRQMIESLNAAGVDLAVFGNHEFDITEKELQNRLNESNFQWVASNTFHLVNGSKTAFRKLQDGISTVIPSSYIMQVRDADGTTIKIGFMGITLPFNKASYVSYSDPLATAKKIYASLKDSCDAIVAITHQALKDDIELAKQLPGLALILGGHEHDMRLEKIGNVFIAKAHANAKSAFIIKLMIDKKKKSFNVSPELKILDESVALDNAAGLVVKKWMDIGDSNYNSLGFDSKQILISVGDTLDGRENQVRSGSTNLTRLIAASMLDACPNADLAIYNAGSIRVDDLLPPPVSQYDIIRTLPFGGAIRETQMKGRLLLKVLDAGTSNVGSGGFLHYWPVQLDTVTKLWTLNNQPIEGDRIYRVAISDFLISGREARLGFLQMNNPDLVKIENIDTLVRNSISDIRLAVIRYLQKQSIPGKQQKSR